MLSGFGANCIFRNTLNLVGVGVFLEARMNIENLMISDMNELLQSSKLKNYSIRKTQKTPTDFVEILMDNETIGIVCRLDFGICQRIIAEHMATRSNKKEVLHFYPSNDYT